MKIAVLSRNPRLYSTRRLVEAGQQRGHEMVVIDTLRAYMNIASHKPQIHYRGQPLEGFDAVIPRIGASVTFYGCAVLRQFEMMGVFPLNESVAIARSRDKLRSLQLLSRKGIGLPITGFAHSPDDVPDLIQMVGGAPLVIKLLEGTQGVGVVLGAGHELLGRGHRALALALPGQLGLALGALRVLVGLAQDPLQLARQGDVVRRALPVRHGLAHAGHLALQLDGAALEGDPLVGQRGHLRVNSGPVVSAHGGVKVRGVRVHGHRGSLIPCQLRALDGGFGVSTMIAARSSGARRTEVFGPARMANSFGAMPGLY